MCLLSQLDQRKNVRQPMEAESYLCVTTDGYICTGKVWLHRNLGGQGEGGMMWACGRNDPGRVLEPALRPDLTPIPRSVGPTWATQTSKG